MSPKEDCSLPESRVIIGDIVEKDTSSFKIIETNVNTQETGFPKIEKITTPIARVPGKSIFAMQMEIKQKQQSAINESQKCTEIAMDITEENNEVSSDVYSDIHADNMNKINAMTKEEIIEERNNLLQTLDPKLIEMFKARKSKSKPISSTKPEALECSASETKRIPDLPELEFLNTEDAAKWLNFDVIELDKLEWMKNIPQNVQKLKPGEKYEARFDWSGYLMPYTTETESMIDDRELYLHGDDVHRPGYTLQELFRLSRSNVLQQRVTAISAISGILAIYNQGYYDSVLEVPISKIFFLFRFAFDENTPIIIDVASNALSKLFYNDIDEILLDTMFESTRESEQPFFRLINPIQEVESKLNAMNINSNISTSLDDESLNDIASLNDFHLAEVDLIECLLRTNILERIRYVLQIKEIEGLTVASCLKILIRIARTSHDCVMRIMSTDSLIDHIIRTAFSDTGDVKAIKLALKLFRIISCAEYKYCKMLECERIENKVKEIIFVREDISSNVIQLQIECFRFLKVWTYVSGNKEFLR